MNKRDIPTVNQPADFGLDELFFSITDRRGIILTGNRVFVRVSQYSRDELVGHPHNIIRHPDMPRAVFKLLWDTILAGQPISAYVKNRAKDGRYYWVVANVFPVGDDFLSVRFKPSSPLLDTVAGLYSQMLAAEVEGGMEASSELLHTTLGQLGFASYPDFMRDMLFTELKSREDFLTAASQTTEKNRPPSAGLGRVTSPMRQVVNLCHEAQTSFRHLFDRLTRLRELAEKILAETAFLRDLARDIRVQSINSSISSVRLGDPGRMLAAVSASLQTTAMEGAESIELAAQSVEEALNHLRNSGFNVCTSYLVFEMLQFFGKEILAQEESDDGDAASDLQREARLNMERLNNLLETYSTFSLDTLGKLMAKLEEHDAHIGDIEKFTRMLTILKTTGAIELSWIEESGEFESIFGALEKSSERTIKEISDFRQASSGIMADMRQSTLSDNVLMHFSAQISNLLAGTAS
jgi:aerotaxis receptor